MLRLASLMLVQILSVPVGFLSTFSVFHGDHDHDVMFNEYNVMGSISSPDGLDCANYLGTDSLCMYPHPPSPLPISLMMRFV